MELNASTSYYQSQWHKLLTFPFYLNFGDRTINIYKIGRLIKKLGKFEETIDYYEFEINVADRDLDDMEDLDYYEALHEKEKLLIKIRKGMKAYLKATK